MLENVLRHIRNWFVQDVYTGTFSIEGGSLTLPSLVEGQYVRIQGSAINDGVYQHQKEELANETFDGEVWALSVPRALLGLVTEIEAWQEKNGEAATGPYQSESFAGYSYTKATDSATGGAVTWEIVFRSRLNPWRKL